MFRFVLTKKKIGQVYIIKNNVNNKVYIGLTTATIELRFRKHLYNALSSYKGGKLYVAMRKYGKHNFKIECLKTCFSYGELAEQERLFIKKYDSYKNGYNSKPGGTLGGNCGTKVVVQGKEFSSLARAASYYSISSELFIARLRYGWSVEEALEIKYRRRKPSKNYNVVVQGQNFECMKDASEHYNICKNRVRYRVWCGWTLEQALGIVDKKYIPPLSQPIKFRDKMYNSKRELTTEYNVDYRLFMNRLRLGFSIEEALGVKLRVYKHNTSKPVEYKGKQYDTIKSLALDYEVNYKALTYQLSKGRTVKEALEVLCLENQ